MNAQQMLELYQRFLKYQARQIHFLPTTPTAHLPKYKKFLMSDKEYYENTKAPVVPEVPLPLQFSSMNDAVRSYKKY